MLVVDPDGQDAVFEAVVVEDVGVAGGDNGVKTVIGNRPRRVFARGAAAEVVADDQDFCAFERRFVQFKFGVVAAVVVITPVVEQVDAKTAAFDFFQELLGDDLVGIDVAAVH